MSCPGITDIVVRETGRFLPGEIFRRSFGVSPWMSLINRGVYPAGLSQIINTLTYERNAPDVAETTWSNVVAVDGQEGGACLPIPNLIDIGSTTRNFQLQRVAFHGPQFCAEEFRSVFDLRKQLDAITNILSERIRLEWESRDRHEYSRMVQRKVVVNDCYNPTEDNNSSGVSTYPATGGCPTQTVGLGLLDKYRIKLLRDGAADSAVLKANGRPLMTVIASEEWVGNIIRLNSDIRQDIRYADMGMGQKARLLQAFGINHEYDGFMFIADLYPRRFTCAAGVFTEVPTWIKVQATKGFKSELNPLWESAPYEELFIFDPTVFTQLVPQPITNPAPNFVFNPISYVGDIKILNIPNETCNPDQNILRHRAILAAGSEPVYPWRGVGFIQKRCDPICNNSTSCTS